MENFIKIVSLNTGSGVNLNSKEIFIKQIEFLKEDQPDIVFLQEIDIINERNNFFNEADFYKQGLNFSYSSFGSTINYKKGLYGILTLSKYPIIFNLNYILPKTNEKTEQRIFLHTRIDFNGEVLDLINTHFSQLETERVLATNCILDYIKKINLKKVILAGDFNFGLIEKAKKDYYYIDLEICPELIIFQKKLFHPNLNYFSFINKNTPKLIDTFFYTKNINLIEFNSIYNNKISDHAKIVGTFII